MTMQAHEFKAKSVDEAIAEGLATLNVARNDVDIEVINKGSRGIFGIGSEPAVVQIMVRTTSATGQPPAVDVPTTDTPMTASPPVDNAPTGTNIEAEEVNQITSVQPQPADDSSMVDDKFDEDELDDDEFSSDEPDGSRSGANRFNDADEYYEDDDESDEESDEESELADLATDLLDEMVHLMGFEAEITATWRDDEDEDEDEDEESSYRRDRYLLVDVEGTDLGALIGRRGETLEHIQYLLRLMVNQQIHQWKNIVVDVEHYKERRITQVTQLAERMAEQVARTGKAISLEPMPANERRIVHMVLRNHPEVYTESYGEGSRRKVHIFAAE